MELNFFFFFCQKNVICFTLEHISVLKHYLIGFFALQICILPYWLHDLPWFECQHFSPEMRPRFLQCHRQTFPVLYLPALCVCGSAPDSGGLSVSPILEQSEVKRVKQMI